MMRNIEDFKDKLFKKAEELKLEIQASPELISSNFKGRGASQDAALPKNIIGVRIGKYPIIIGELNLASEQKIEDQIKSFHNQSIVARSFLDHDQVVDIHVFLVCIEPKAQNEKWLSYIDKIERDEAYCRKLVWVKVQEDPSSFEKFIDRTFLARPWSEIRDEESNAQLDYNTRLVQQVLENKGLSTEAALKWISILDEPPEDLQKTVEQLVDAMGENHE